MTDTGGAGVEHGQQRRQAVEGRPVTDAGGHGDDGDLHEAGHHRREGPLHPRRHHDHPRPTDGLGAIEEPVEPGDSNVVDAVDIGPVKLGGDGRLLGHGEIGRARRDHGDHPGEGHPCPAVHRDAAGRLVIDGLRTDATDGAVHLGGRPGHEDALAPSRDPLHDGDHLLRGLPAAEHGLGKAPAQGPMVVDLGEPQVFVGQRGQALGGRLGSQGAVAHLLEQVLEASRIH